MLLQKERELVAEYGRKMSADRLSPGTSGNISVYNADTGLMAISPSGMNYSDITPGDVAVTDLKAHIADGKRKPSSEWALHTEFYRSKPGIGAVVHTHSVYCATFAALRKPLLAVHYVIGDAGAAIVPCAPYRTYGTPELAKEAVRACGAGNAVLLANHGAVVCGTDLKNAYGLAWNLEYIAQIQYQAESIGNPVVLNAEEMERVMRKFRTYGQPESEKGQ